MSEYGKYIPPEARNTVEKELGFEHIYELKDKDGKVICVSRVVYYDNKELPVDEIGGVSACRLKSFAVEKDGKEFKIIGPHDFSMPVNIFVASKVDEGGFYMSREKGKKERALVIPPLDNPIGIAVALHEFGHLLQSHVVFFESVKDVLGEFNSSGSARLPLFSDHLSEKFERLLKIFPELLPFFPSQDIFDRIDEFCELARTFYDVESTDREIALLREKFKGEMPKRIRIETERDLAYYTKRKGELEKKVSGYKVSGYDVNKDGLATKYREITEPLKQILKIVAKVLERDATKRAFQIMGMIHREIGADLMSPEVDFSGMPYNFFKQQDDGCSESTMRVVGDIQKFGGFSARGALLSALGTYDAFDRIPVPNLTRIEQMKRDK